MWRGLRRPRGALWNRNHVRCPLGRQHDGYGAQPEGLLIHVYHSLYLRWAKIRCSDAAIGYPRRHDDASPTSNPVIMQSVLANTYGGIGPRIQTGVQLSVARFRCISSCARLSWRDSRGMRMPTSSHKHRQIIWFERLPRACAMVEAVALLQILRVARAQAQYTAHHSTVDG